MAEESTTYTTESGDAWDLIAYKVYGDEMKADWLMQNNIKLLDTFIFDAGTVLYTPPLPETKTNSGLPAWRQG